MKVNHSLSDISLENICREFRIQLESAKEHVQKECEEDAKVDLEAFWARILSSPAASLPPTTDLVTKVTSWAEAHGFKLITNTEDNEDDGRGKRQDLREGKEEDEEWCGTLTILIHLLLGPSAQCPIDTNNLQKEA
jgi:hypothetical protein